MFWRVSPRQINAIIGGASDRVLHQHNEMVWLAWHIVALGRTKKLPKLEKLLAKHAAPKRQTWQQQQAVMDQWVAHTARVARQRKSNRSKK